MPKAAGPGAVLHGLARADFEKICVLIKALPRRNTLCISRGNDEIRAQIFRKTPKPDRAAQVQKAKKTERLPPLRFLYGLRTK